MNNIRTAKDSTAALTPTYQIPSLPLSTDLESKAVMKKEKEARAALAELKGVAKSMPNQGILTSTLSLQEAKDSSAIENIITTNDELYKSDVAAKQFATHAAKEVHQYASALRSGFFEVKTHHFLTNNIIKAVQAELEGNDAGFRPVPGTSLKNDSTGEIIYVPPQSLADIEAHMKNLEQFINEDELCNLDPLVKMAIIHHQFESIHPFFDGNGRTGRIINILYLVKLGLLDTPILYLSRYINQNKADYYRLLQAVRDEGSWEEWVLFILEGVRQTALQTIRLIEAIRELMQEYKRTIRGEREDIYTQDLLNLIFSHPYTKISHAEQILVKTRPTATKYLRVMVELGLMREMKLGRDVFFINHRLMEILSNVHDL